MNDLSFVNSFVENWPIWVVTITLIVAATIDGIQLKVPNWITYPMIFSGWIFSLFTLGWEGFGYSLIGTVVGLALLLPLYAVGGMGAGDVKLLAGIGAWVGTTHTTNAFMISAILGAFIAVGMVAYRRAWKKHAKQFVNIATEFVEIHDPVKLSEIAAERKQKMLLLPYGIPIAIGTIFYFAYSGMLI